MKRGSTIALLTDFGLGDPYVGVMKGVIRSLNPDATVIDLSHDVSPFNIDQAAFLLWSSYRYFPENTLFVCVIDPGVGSARSIVCAEVGKYMFLTPNNGIMKFVLAENAPRRTVEISQKKYFLREVSATFHGRDIFAPVAARLAAGLPPTKLGKSSPATPESEAFVRITRGLKREYLARILHVDRFGNCVTNVKLDSMVKNITIEAGRHRVTRRAEFYLDGPDRQPFAIVGSTGLLEISMRLASAAAALDLHPSQAIHIKVRDDERRGG